MPTTTPDLTLATARATAERAALLRALVEAAGHRGDAAALLGVSPRTLSTLLAAHVTAADLEALTKAHGWPRRGGEGLHHDRKPTVTTP